MSFKYTDNPFHKKEDTYKVYLKSITEIDDEKIEKYKRETVIRKFIYTDQNILEIINEKNILKLNIMIFLFLVKHLMIQILHFL